MPPSSLSLSNPSTRPGTDRGMPRDGSGGCTGCCREGFPKRQRFLSSATKEHKDAKRKGGRLGEETPRRFALGKDLGVQERRLPWAGVGGRGPFSHGETRCSGPDSKQQKRKCLVTLLVCETVTRGGYAGELGPEGWVLALSPTPL